MSFQLHMDHGVTFINMTDVLLWKIYHSNKLSYYELYIFKTSILLRTNNYFIVKGLITELTPLHIQNVGGFMKEMVRAARLAAYCNYLSK